MRGTSVASEAGGSEASGKQTAASVGSPYETVDYLKTTGALRAEGLGCPSW